MEIYSSHSRQQHPRRWRIVVQLYSHNHILPSSDSRRQPKRGQEKYYTPRKDHIKTARYLFATLLSRVHASCISQLYNFSSFLFKERGNLWAFKERDRKKRLFLQFISSIPSTIHKYKKHFKNTYHKCTLFEEMREPEDLWLDKE